MNLFIHSFQIAEDFIPDDFLRADVRVGEARHLIFATEHQLDVMSSAKTWYLDGTFKVLLTVTTINLYKRHTYSWLLLMVHTCIIFTCSNVYVVFSGCKAPLLPDVLFPCLHQEWGLHEAGSSGVCPDVTEENCGLPAGNYIFMFP